MKPFTFNIADNLDTALQKMQANPAAKFLAGGTNILDLMKEDVENPSELVELNKLGFQSIERIRTGIFEGGVSIGGLAKNSQTANHPLIRQNYPLLSKAILAGASAQIRNMASNAGNLMQRTRCSYFYDISMPCNKRDPGSGCGAMEGINRMHAVFGWSDKCIAVFPSDMAVALAALDAVVVVISLDGSERRINFTDFHRLPANEPQYDNILAHGEVISSIELPPSDFKESSYYLKVRDRASFAFALVSTAAGIVTENGQITKVRLAMGGVAHKPWRAYEAERYLIGKSPELKNFQLAADEEMKMARPLKYNKFKIELGKRSIALALLNAYNKISG